MQQPINFNREYIPADIERLLNTSFEIADNLATKLNNPECPFLKDLFEQIGEKTYKRNDIFNTHGLSFRKGIYLFGEVKENKINPVYVGISRNITTRLRQHGWGKPPNQASLAYLIADKSMRPSYPIEGSEFRVTMYKQGNRDQNVHFCDVKGAQTKVQNFKVAAYQIENEYELYFHEVAIACILKTYWNSFRTH